MAELNFITMAGGLLRPADEDVAETVRKWGVGNLIIGKFRRPRNYKFLQKFYVMLDVGYDAWEPPSEVEFHGKTYNVEKNKERFRKDCIISAGYYETVVNFRGDVRAEAKSISYGSMGEDEFGVLYNKVQNVILQNVLKNYTKEDYDNVVTQMMNFI